MAVQDYRLRNLDYTAIKVQTDKNTAVIPDTYIQDSTLDMKPSGVNGGEDTRTAGNKAARQKLLRGLRTYEGTWNLFAEPNTTYYLLNMLYAAGTTTGVGPYTTVFDVTSTTEPKAYTMDVAKNGKVERFIGVEAKGLSDAYEEGDNTAHWETELVAHNHFSSALISATPIGAGPSTVILKTTFDPSPTAGLVVGDTMTARNVSADTYTSLTIASIVDATSFTTTENATSLSEDDELYIAPQTGITFATEQTAFEWGTHTLKLAATIAALGAASNICAEQDTTLKLIHGIENDTGNTCMGNLHPTQMRRMMSDAEVSVKRRKGDDENLDIQYLHRVAQSIQYNWTSESIYSLVVTGNSVQIEENEVPANSGELYYNTSTYKPGWDSVTSKNLGVTLVNNLDTT